MDQSWEDDLSSDFEYYLYKLEDEGEAHAEEEANE